VIGVAIVAAAAFAGGAYAATQDSTTNVRQAFLTEVAKRLHVTPKQLSSALQGAALDQINAAVASGRLTQAQANALKQRVERGRLPLLGLAGTMAFRHVGPFGGPGQLSPAAGGLAFPRPGTPRPLGAGSGPLAAAATYLGITRTQLLSQLAAGKSLAQIAAAHGKPASGLKAAILASVKAKLDKAVAAKLMTTSQEQHLLSRLSDRLDNLIDRSLPRFGFGPAGKGPILGPALRRPSAAGAPPQFVPGP
jgi:uncharacterized coiled-coil protein SlyX